MRRETCDPPKQPNELKHRKPGRLCQIRKLKVVAEFLVHELPDMADVAVVCGNRFGASLAGAIFYEQSSKGHDQQFLFLESAGHIRQCVVQGTKGSAQF